LNTLALPYFMEKARPEECCSWYFYFDTVHFFQKLKMMPVFVLKCTS